jgi:uncharacterized protein
LIQLTPQFFEGIDLFNREEFFECHEVLEDVWNLQVDPEKQLTQGVIQLAVGLYHARRDNFVGAVKLITRALERIDRSVDLTMPLDLKQLRADAAAALDAVREQRVPSTFTITLLN